MQGTCLERQFRFMQQRPSLAFSRVMQLENDTPAFQQQDSDLWRLPEIIPPSAAALAFFICGNIPGNLSNVMVRASAWRRAGRFREDLPYAGDLEFWFRIAAREPFGVLHERLNFVRSHPGQASVFLNRNNELVQQADEVLAAIYRHLPAATRQRSVTRLWGTINFVTQFIHWGVRRLLAGNSPNLKDLRKRRTYAFSFPVSCLFYLLTVNRRFGLATPKAQLMSDLSVAINGEQDS